MKSHLWVKIQYTPVHVQLESDGTLSISVEPVAEDVSNDDAVFGCGFCNEHLTTDSFNTECADDSPIKGNLPGTLTGGD